MTAKKNVLKRGLSELLSQRSQDVIQPGREVVDNDLKQLPIEFLQPNRYQPRKVIRPEALQELADSISAKGIIQPIVARQLSGNTYEIIAGERRWRAAQEAGLAEVPVIVKSVSDEMASVMALVENIQREDLNCMEEAIALSRLSEEFELTHEQIAKAVGKSRTAVSNLLRLLKLEPDVKRLVEYGDLELGHAKVLLALSGNLQIKAAHLIVERELPVRQAETLISQLQKEPTAKVEQKVSADIINLQNQLSEKLGAAVAVQHGSKGKGKLVISYNSLNELDGILAHIK